MENGIQDTKEDELHHESLALQLKLGYRHAAEELVDHYYQKIYLYMRQLGHDAHESEDLTQEAFIRAWCCIHQIRDSRTLHGWLFRIAGNISRDRWRKKKRRDLIQKNKINIHVIDQEESNDQENLLLREELDKVQEGLNHLTWKLKQAIVLHYLQGFKITEAAEAAGIKEGTLKSRLNRALEQLRTFMQDD